MIDSAHPTRPALTRSPDTTQPATGSRRLAALRAHALDAAVGVGLFVVSLLVYNATLTPSLSYLSPDGNELATVPYLLGLVHSTGYPLYTWLGKLFTFVPIGDVAHRMNLMSATMGAGGIALMYGVILLLLERMRPERAGQRSLWMRTIAAMVALLFAFSVTFWSQTGIAEVYAPNLLMVALQMLLILNWARVEEANPAGRGQPPSARSLAWFGAFCLAFALSTGTHISNLGFGLGYLVFVLAVNWRFALKPRAIIIGVGLFALGLLQHLWLPYKASTLTDSLMRANMPNTWKGFYNYTLGAFPQMKFAFTWAQVPDRIVIYLDLLRQQFSLVGVLIGIAGMWVLLFRQPKRWWLITLMYLVHLVFFTQYRVFDLDVFFIPAHFLFALFIAVGMDWLLQAGGGWLHSRWPALVERFAVAKYALAALLVIIPAGWQLAHNWEKNDRSGDMAINDFYENVFEMLPPDSVLLGQSGVFGYDMFYWRLVYNVRPDVLMPHLPGTNERPQNMEDRPLFSTIRADGPGAARGPWGPPRGLISEEVWSIPILLGGSVEGSIPARQQELVLYALSETPPEMFVSQADPQIETNVAPGGLTLLGYDLDTRFAYPGGRLHLTLYWQTSEPHPIQITTALGEVRLESHVLGLGNLPRILNSTAPSGEVLVEDYWVVIPSTLEAGQWPLIVTANGESVSVGEVQIGEAE